MDNPRNQWKQRQMQQKPCAAERTFFSVEWPAGVEGMQRDSGVPIVKGTAWSRRHLLVSEEGAAGLDNVSSRIAHRFEWN